MIVIVIHVQDLHLNDDIVIFITHHPHPHPHLLHHLEEDIIITHHQGLVIVHIHITLVIVVHHLHVKHYQYLIH
jgi:hypothetical protein